MKNYLVLFTIVLLSIASHSVQAQNVSPVLITALPDSLFETSGVEVINKNNIWTHNDSGDKPRIFNIDTNGNVLRILWLALDSVVDCEDITRDDSANFYLGDFGNNDNVRQDLRIYKFQDPDTLSGDTAVPQIIRFQYPDQLLFPPDADHLNYDCEAMFHYHDSLYLFSKNRATARPVRMYRLPDLPGNYIAELVDSFSTNLWITSADISPSGKTMVLLSETKLRIFSEFEGSHFFSGNYRELSMNYTQKESVVFVDDSSVYLADERIFNTGGNLYSLDLRPWMLGVSQYQHENSRLEIFPNPATDRVNIRFSLPEAVCKRVELWDVQGRCLSKSLPFSLVSAGNVRCTLPSLSAGMYVINVFTEEGYKITERFSVETAFR